MFPILHLLRFTPPSVIVSLTLVSWAERGRLTQTIFALIMHSAKPQSGKTSNNLVHLSGDSIWVWKKVKAILLSNAIFVFSFLAN